MKTNRSRVSLFYSLKSLSLDGAVFILALRKYIVKETAHMHWQKANS